MFRFVLDQLFQFFAIHHSLLVVIFSLDFLEQCILFRLFFYILLRFFLVHIFYLLPLFQFLIVAAQILLLSFRNFGASVNIPLLRLVVEFFGLQLDVNGIDFFLDHIVFLFFVDVLHLAFQVVLYLLLLSIFIYLTLVCFFLMLLRVTVYHLAPEAILFFLEKKIKESDDLS